MPYSPEHAAETRRRILDSARRLFNRHGFSEVSIDDIMAGAGLTRGGFYHHFKTKDELYAEAITHARRCDASQRMDGTILDPCAAPEALMRQLVSAYLSRGHLDSTDHQCPLVALSSDVARSSMVVRGAYQDVLLAMTGLFQRAMPDDDDGRRRALSLAALCVGGMTLARSVADPSLADEIRAAVLASALSSRGQPIAAQHDGTGKDGAQTEPAGNIPREPWLTSAARS